jgi:hypothetical protein
LTDHENSNTIVAGHRPCRRLCLTLSFDDNHNMKALTVLLLAGSLLMTGCISATMVNHKAKPFHEWDKERNEMVDTPGQPAYYALLPVTVPLDIVLSPFMLPIYIQYLSGKD